MESHFVHQKCADCNRMVVLIGDLEFELHRPSHCNGSSVGLSNTNLYLSPAPLVDATLSIKSESEFEVNTGIQSNDDDDFLINLKCDTKSTAVANEDKKKPRQTTKRQRKVKKTEKVDAKKAESSNSESDRNDDDDYFEKMCKSGEKKPYVRKRYAALPKTIACTQEGCDKMFGHQRTLGSHLKRDHGIVEKNICPTCNMELSDKSNLKHHMITHTDDKRFICSVSYIVSIALF